MNNFKIGDMITGIKYSNSHSNPNYHYIITNHEAIMQILKINNDDTITVIIRDHKNKAQKCNIGNIYQVHIQAVKKINDSQKLTVIPKYVADWIEEHSKNMGNTPWYNLQARIDFLNRILFVFDNEPYDEISIDNLMRSYIRNNMCFFVNAILNGYEVEPEVLYTVKLKNGYSLYKSKYNNNLIYFSTEGFSELTKEEIESIDDRLFLLAEKSN